MDNNKKEILFWCPYNNQSPWDCLANVEKKDTYDTPVWHRKERTKDEDVGEDEEEGWGREGEEGEALQQP